MKLWKSISKYRKSAGLGFGNKILDITTKAQSMKGKKNCLVELDQN